MADFETLLTSDFQPLSIADFQPLTTTVFAANLSCDSLHHDYSVVETLTLGDQADDTLLTQELGHSYIFDISKVNSALATGLSDNFNYIGWACGCIVFFFLWFSFRSLKLAMLSFLPMAISWVWILGLMGLLDIQFNIVNVILATFIFGQGDDYTIFMTEGAVYEQKYGIRDWRGGGRASARETAARVVAGAIAKQELATKGISIQARLVQVGAETNPARFNEIIAAYQREGDSIGGIIECRICGLPVGTGEPIFDKLQAHLAFAVMSINACKGFEYGTGFEGITQPGSAINHISGGIAGGISDGSEIIFRCVFKPTPTTKKALTKLLNDQINEPIVNRQIVNRQIVNRSDACVAVRAVPVVEAMTALSLVQFL